VKYLVLLILIIILYSVLFHLIMLYAEGRYHSWITGLYWTLPVMTILSFGDITPSPAISAGSASSFCYRALSAADPAATKFEIASPRAEFLRDSATLVNSRTAELNPDFAGETDNVWRPSGEPGGAKAQK
jgi:hypothetical protein